MTQTKRKQMFTQLYDHTGFERRLGEMALRGWKLEQCGGFLGWRFCRIDPAPLVYKVVYFPDASEFDPAPGDRQAEFIELCEQSGWEYIDHSAQMLIFCSRVPDPIPIETDAMMQVETIHKAMKKNYLPGQIALLVLAIIQILIMTYRIRTELMNVLIYDGLLVSTICYFLIFMMCVHHLAEYFLWRRNALDAAADGVFVETRGSNLLEKTVLVLLAVVFGTWMASISDDMALLRVAALTFVTLIGVIALVNGVKQLLQKLNVSAETNRIITAGLIVVGTVFAMLFIAMDIIGGEYEEGNAYVGTYEFAGSTQYVYNDPIPLTLEDLGVDADYEDRSRVGEVTESVMVSIYNGQEVAPWGTSVDNPPELYYTVTVPRLRFLVEPCAEDILEDNRIRNLYGLPQPTDPGLWGAERVYEHQYPEGATGYYTAVYNDRIVEIYFPYVPTAEQIETAAAVLRDLEIQ